MWNKIYQGTMIAIVAGVVAVGGIFYFFYMPAAKEVRILKSELKKTAARNQRINKLGQDAKFFDDLISKVAMLQEELQSLMPKQVKLSALLRELSLLAKKNNVMLVSIKPVVQDDKFGDNGDVLANLPKNVTNSKIEIVLECSYENLGRYIKSIENNILTIMTVRNISIEPGEDKDPDKLNVYLTIDAFYQEG